MKKLLSILIIFFCAVAPTFANNDDESERIPPHYNTKIEHNLTSLDIEGTVIHDVRMVFESSGPEVGRFVPFVNVRVYNSKNKCIYRRRFENCYLYIFSNGGIQVGLPRYNKVVIFPNEVSDFYGYIREREGVYPQTINK